MKKDYEQTKSSKIQNILIYIIFAFVGLIIGGILSYLIVASSSWEKTSWTVILVMALSLIGGIGLGHAIVLPRKTGDKNRTTE